ncbi:MAG: Lrp/AsnC ligand binding domain-containing protein [Nitrosopumilus sp.]|nr:Lrp/AsnC ligand binding domain-containing protein [Nitrosopumilus sp.]MBL7015509.1 Lrp/AsnC ligand binding domain-containing protein [Nitrosopumilus sp.]MBL7017795.1 Lrp/AsnC ligand binding domain-containing protein [Nitrosopumilus sp.]
MTKAYILIVNESGKEDSIISNLKNIPSITNAFGAFGTYDIIIKLESNSEQTLHHDISYGIRKIPNIRDTLTLLVQKSATLKINKLERDVLDTYMAQAFVTIHCLKSQEDSVIQNLNTIPEVIEIDMLIGSYELICKIAAPTYNHISEIISQKIRKIPGIKSTNTINLITNQGFSR